MERVLGLIFLPMVHGIMVFETANAWTGTFSGIANGDISCSLSSQAASGTRFFNVPVLSFLSSSTINATSRFASLKYPVYMGDGTFAASNITALLSTNLAGRIVDQSGAARTAGFWTGTMQTGVYSGSNCGDWSAPTGQWAGTIGSSLGGASWANYATLSCSGNPVPVFSLLCVQYDYAAPGSIATGIHIFQTSTLYNGSLGGILGADAICNTAAAGFPALSGRVFRALLSTSTAVVSSRIQPGKPLLGIDGVTLGASVAVTSLPYTIATGTATVPQTNFWLGMSSSSCSDWTSAAAGTNGADATSSMWLTGAPNTIPCSSRRPLVCVESSPPCVLDPCDYAPPYCQERGDYFGRTCSCPPGTVGNGLPGKCVSLIFNSFSVTSGATIVSTNKVLLASTAAGSVFTVIVALNGTGKNATAPANSWTFSMKLTSSGAPMDVPCTALTNNTKSLLASNTNTVALTCTLATGGGQSLAAVVSWCVTFAGASTQYCSTLTTPVMFNYPPPTITPGTIRRDINAPGSTSYVSTFAGGTVVFEGTNFQPSIMQVYLGQRPSNLQQFKFTLSSLSNLTMVYCFAAAGNGLNLVFTVAVGSQTVTGTDTYAYPTLPYISSVRGCPTPNGQGTADCPTTGGVTLQIFGTAFFGDLTVLVDMKSCINVISNLTWISCVLPAGTGVGRAILVNSMSTLSAPQNFISYAPPTISSFSVDTDCASVDNTTLINCDRSGGARLTITGSNFGVSGASVHVGTVPCNNPSNEGTQDSVVTCTLPPGNFFNQPVILSVLGGGTTTTGSISYTPCDIGTQQDPNNQTLCDPCPRGSANDQTGDSCTACEVGKYTNSPGQVSCTKCPAGSVQNTTASTSCSQCPVGRYSIVDGQVSCLPCEIGSYTVSTGQTSCFFCPQGTYQSTSGMSFCSTCQPGTYSSASGQQSCPPCELGKHGSGITPCQLCPAGKFQNMSSQTDCWNCTLGRASNSPGQVACQDCGPGSFANETATTTCNLCTAGTYQESINGKICSLCSVGFYTPDPGQAGCHSCVSGTFNTAEGESTCIQCPAGRYQLGRGESFCSICDTGKYAVGATTCDFCGPTSTSVNGICLICPRGTVASFDRTRCECLQGSYMNNETNCVACSEGLDCSSGGLTQSELTTVAGWWRSSNQSIAPSQCINAANCAGKDACAPYRTGLLCIECVPGYRSSSIGGPCQRCASHSKSMGYSVGIFILAAIALIFVYVLVLRQTKYLERQLVDRVKNSPGDLSAAIEANKNRTLSFGSNNDHPNTQSTSGASNSGNGLTSGAPSTAGSSNQSMLSKPMDLALFAKPMDFHAPVHERAPNFVSQCKIFIGFLQVLLSIVHHGDLTWPTGFAQLLNALSFLNFDFIPWQSLACAVLMDGLTQAVVVCIIPILALLLAAPVPVVLLLIDKFEFSDIHENRVRRGIALRKFIRIFLFTCFLFYPYVSSAVLSVYNCRNVEGVLYLKADSTILCDSSQWRSRAYPLVIAVLAYPVGIPTFCLYLLYQNRKKLNEPTTLLSIGSLYEPYSKDYWFFEVVDMLYKMTMTSLVVLAHSSRQLPLDLGLTGAYLMLLLVSDPYKRLADFQLHSFLLADILVLLVFAVTLQQVGPLTTLADVLLSVFLIALVVLMVMFFVMVVVTTMKGTLYSWIRGRELKRETASEDKDQQSLTSQEGGNSILRSNLRSTVA